MSIQTAEPRLFCAPQHRTPEYEAAVRALGDLLRRSPGAVDRAYAEAVSGHVRARFAATWKESRAERQVLKRLCGDGYAPWPAWTDHPTVWKHREKGGLALVSQPYGLGLEGLVSTVALARKTGCRLTIDAAWSWHFPGRTLAVVWELPA